MRHPDRPATWAFSLLLYVPFTSSYVLLLHSLLLCYTNFTFFVCVISLLQLLHCTFTPPFIYIYLLFYFCTFFLMYVLPIGLVYTCSRGSKNRQLSFNFAAPLMLQSRFMWLFTCHSMLCIAAMARTNPPPPPSCSVCITAAECIFRTLLPTFMYSPLTPYYTFHIEPWFTLKCKIACQIVNGTVLIGATHLWRCTDFKN